MILDWYDATIQSLINLWQGFLAFLPNILGAAVIFFIGWLVSAGIGKLIAGILSKLKFNQIFEKGSWKRALEKAEVKVSASDFIGAIFKWILVIAFLMAAVEILGLIEFSGFLSDVLGYFGNVILAVLIFIVAVVVIDILSKLVVALAEGTKFVNAHVAGEIVKWAMWIFVIFAILRQLLVAPALVDILFGGITYGIVALLVISFGLAFGLGGKEVAADFLQNLRSKLRK